MAWSYAILEKSQTIRVANTLKVPSWLRPLHGYSTTPGELSLAYLTAGAFTSLVLISIQDRLAELSQFQATILVVVSLDLAGGAVANLSQGTRTFWRSRTVNLRLFFLAVHAIHLLGLAYVFPEAAASATLAYLWMLASGTIVILTGNTSVPLALSLVLVGAAVIQLPQGLEPAASLLLTVYLVKLVFCFGGGSREQGIRAS